MGLRAHALTKDHGYRLAAPKDPSGGGSVRDVPIGRTLASRLAERRREQMGELEGLDGEWDETAYVVGSAARGTWMSPDVLGRERRTLASVEGWRGTRGERLRLHDLRHTYATLAIKDKVMDVMALSRILGHRDVSMTLDLSRRPLTVAPTRMSAESLDLQQQ